MSWWILAAVLAGGALAVIVIGIALAVLLLQHTMRW